MGYTERRARRSLLPEKKEEQELIKELEAMRIPTAAYCRLSMEGDESIENQIQLVEGYIQDSPDLLLVDTYVDNGFTGTSFDRPEWNRLMLDVQQGRINAIVVKDLSRFGRHYVEAGRYINDIFPKLGVRFIAITDDFDNTRASDRDDLIVPVKNMVNYYYARDMSQKVHATFEEKKKSGELLGAPAFGYFRANTEVQRNLLRIDEEHAPIVRMMYRWAAAGVDMSDIARRLNLMGVPSPWGCRWRDQNLRLILSNPVYYGTFISGKWVVNMHQRTKTDRESWLVFEDHHEGLVSRELWDAAQEKMKVKVRGEKIPKALDGLLYCSTCGRQLGVRRQSGKVIYHCPMHTGQGLLKTGSAPLTRAPQIVETELKKMVLRECRDYMKWIEGCREAIRTADQNTGLMGKLKRKSISLMKQKKEAESTLMQIYQDYRDGMLDMQSFMDLREQLSNEKANAEKEITDILSMQRQTKIRVKKVREFLTTIDGLVFYSWNEELLRRIVEKVELKPDGTVKVALMMKDEIEKLTMED